MKSDDIFWPISDKDLLPYGTNHAIPDKFNETQKKTNDYARFGKAKLRLNLKQSPLQTDMLKIREKLCMKNTKFHESGRTFKK